MLTAKEAANNQIKSIIKDIVALSEQGADYVKYHFNLSSSIKTKLQDLGYKVIEKEQTYDAGFFSGIKTYKLTIISWSEE